MISTALLDILACPRDGLPLVVRRKDRLSCSADHEFPVFDGIPVLLCSDLPPTHPCLADTRAIIESGRRIRSEAGLPGDAVDPYVQGEILKTNGQLYKHLVGSLDRYPIPEMRLPLGNGARLLDVGCNWGRWTFAAARAGYRSVGVDPWIEGTWAGKRVARQLGLEVDFVVGDARQLPFKREVFDVAYSYSVLQHFAKSDARAAWAQMSRVTRADGTVLIQMPNILGVRQAYNRIFRTRATAADPFRVRYWTPWELRKTGRKVVGPTETFVDGYFSLNPQVTDLDLMPSHLAAVVRCSDILRRASTIAPWIGEVADSLYVKSVRQAGPVPDPQDPPLRTRTA